MNMIPLTFIYSHDSVFQSVKQESSQLAIRKKDNEGNSMFENLVFDEAYLIKFRELFFQAQAKVTPALSKYMKDVPVEPECYEKQDFTKNRDYIFHLLMPDDFNQSLRHSIDISIDKFLYEYILYEWLKTKSPQDAATYLESANDALKDVKSNLEVRTKPRRRKTSWF